MRNGNFCNEIVLALRYILFSLIDTMLKMSNKTNHKILNYERFNESNISNFNDSDLSFAFILVTGKIKIVLL